MSLPENPLKALILQLLREAKTTLSEHQLIILLKAHQTLWPSMAEAPQLALFQIHFMTMNALYQLQDELRQEHVYLQVGPLNIGIVGFSEANAKAIPSASPCDSREGKLRAYYLDWDNYEATDDDEVKRLLDSFWSRYANQDQQSQAFAVLGLKPGAGWPLIRQSYRRMAAQHHPDRGGEVQNFLEIREAYELLSGLNTP